MCHNAIQGINENTGVRIPVEEKIATTFTRVNDKICFTKIQLDKYVIFEQNPAIKEDFYESLSEVTNRINESRHMLITIGDFNTKTGTGKTEFPVKNRQIWKG